MQNNIKCPPDERESPAKGIGDILCLQSPQIAAKFSRIFQKEINKLPLIFLLVALAKYEGGSTIVELLR